MDLSTTIQQTEKAPESGAVDIAGLKGLERDSGDGGAAAWMARAAIIAVACGMAWYTWAHWGDFQVDCGRELYVPAAILKGKLLFRDIWYMYGPLAPYLQALLFRVFGVHLTVLYLFGSALTIGSAILTFEIARQFDLSVGTSLVPALFFLAEAFYPYIFNFVFPYSYAASLGAFLGMACLYFVLRYLRDVRTLHFALASTLAGLAVLTKQEFGLACLVLLGLAIAGNSLARRSASDIVRNCSVCLAGLSPAFAVYAWFTWKVSPKVLFFDNWISTPGTYFMREWGPRTMAAQGLRFSLGEFLEVAEYALLAVALWSTIASLNALAIKKLRLRSRFAIVTLVAFNLVPIAIILNTDWATKFLLLPLTKTLRLPGVSFISAFTAVQDVVNQMILPKGLFLFGLVFAIQAVWKFWRYKRCVDLCAVALGTYAILVSVRVMLGTSPSPYKYALFFNVPLFLIFVIYLDQIVRWAARSMEAKQSSFLASSALCVEIVVLFVGLFPKPRALPTPFTTEYGTFYTRPDVAEIFPKAISFMKTHTQNGKDILVLPEPPSLYVFAGMEAPSRWYSLLPGVLAPEQEPEFINDLVSNNVKYILIGNRSLAEYGVLRFGEGYDRLTYQWMMMHYVKVGQFGPIMPKAVGLPYMMWIYARKDIAEAQAHLSESSK